MMEVLYSMVSKQLKTQLCNFVKEKIKCNEYLPLRELGRIFGISHMSVKSILQENNLYDQYLSLRNLDNKTKSSIKYYSEQAKIWKKKYEQLKKESGLELRIVELFKSAITPFKYNTTPKLYTPTSTPSTSFPTEEPILILSDIHYGAYISSDETMNFNSYNPQIAKERILCVYEKFISTIMRFESKGGKYSNVNLWLLGDIVEGIIHDELIGNTPIVDQVIEVAELLSEIVYDLSKRFDSVEVVGVVGNHGRTQQKVYFKNKYSNFDYLVYKFMEVKCSQLKNVTFFIPKSPMCIVKKFGKFNFLLRHGDGKSYSYAGIPVYGILRQSSKIQQIMSSYKGMYVHYEILGHYHSSMELPKVSGSIIVCGSIKGVDEYSFNNFLVNEPSQTMLLVNESDGVFARIDLKC